MRWLPASLMLAAAVLALPCVGRLNAYWMHVAIIAMYYAILASSWSLLAGYVGLFSLSHMAFASIGGYTSGMLTQWLHVPIPFGLLAGVIVCCAGGGAIGWVCLRMSGPYLAIFTLGFSEIVRITIATEDDVTAGMAGLHTEPLFASATRLPYFYVAFALLAASLLLMSLLVRSRWGLFLRAIRESCFVHCAPADTEERLFALAATVPGLDYDRLVHDCASGDVAKAFAADREETRRPNDYALTLQETHEGKGNAKPDGDGWRYVFPTILFRGPGGEHTVPGWQPWDAYVAAMEAAQPGSTESPRADPSPEQALARWSLVTECELSILCGPDAAPPESAAVIDWGAGVAYARS